MLPSQITPYATRCRIIFEGLNSSDELRETRCHSNWPEAPDVLCRGSRQAVGRPTNHPSFYKRPPSPILYHWTRINLLPLILYPFPYSVNTFPGRLSRRRLTRIPSLPTGPPRARTQAVNGATACRKTGIILFTPDTMDQHYSPIHPPAAAVPTQSPAAIEPIHCRQCNLKFFTKQSLDEHCATIHRASPDTLPLQPTPCDKCHILFYSQESIDQHRATVHPTTRFARARRHAARGGQFWCALCSKHFINQHALDQHMVSAAHPSAC